MATKSQVMKLAAQLGVTVEEHYDGEGVTLDSPAGKTLGSTGGHCHVARYMPDFDKKSVLWDECLEALQLGVDECDIPDCDVCEEESE